MLVQFNKNGFFTEKAHDGLQYTPTNAPDFKPLFEDLSQRFVEETRKNDNKYEASKLHCENMLREKENLLLSQKKTIDSYHVKMNEANELKLIYDNLKQDYDKITSAHLVEQKNLTESYESVLNDKNKEITNLNDEVKEMKSKVNIMTKLVKIDGNMFRIKPKSRGSGKNLNIQTRKCEYPDCDSIDIDSIKCNRCSKWVCEVCQEVPGMVSKLKPIFNKCKTLYFLQQL